MSGSPLVAVTAEDLWQELSELVEGKLRAVLAHAGPGQRLRVTTLPEAVMTRVCTGLGADPRWVARVLSVQPREQSVFATPTKLIELRNTLSEPLLVFIPPGMRTAAEDSLDVATFTELSLEGLTEELAVRMWERLELGLRDRVRDGLDYLREERHLRNADQEVDYLLTIDRNGGDARAAGGALFRLGLVPDFKVFDQTNPRHALSRNLTACAKLSDSGQPLQLRITRLGIEPKTIQGKLFDYLRQRSAADVSAWAEPIACDPQWHELSFDRWPFADQGDSDELRLIMEPLELPVQKADEITGAAQVPVLNLEAKKPLKIAFRSVPKPIRIPRWKNYRIQLFALSGEKPNLAWESNNFRPPAGHHRKIYRSIKVKDLEDLDEGTYFARVEAYDASGGLLTGRYEQSGDAGTRIENESETFLITRRETPVELPQQRAVHVVSLLDAWIQLAARALGAGDLILAVPDRARLTGCWRESPAAAPRGDVHFRFAGEADGWTVVMPALLRKLELTILENSAQLGAYALDLEASKLADVTVDRRELPPLPDDPEVREFLAARSAVFAAIAGQHLARAAEGEEDERMRRGVVETADLPALAAEIDACADAFRRLAERAAAEPALARSLAQIDTVQLRWKRTGSGDPRSALLAAPTHPLRLLWHLQHAAVCGEAIDSWREGRAGVALGSWKTFTDELRREILPLNLPMALFDHRGIAYVEQGPLTPFWILYLPAETNGGRPVDVPACRERVRRGLGIKGQPPAPGAVGAGEIAARLFGYLRQHPYVEQLRLNVFNAAGGDLLADTLRQLERLLRERDRNAPPVRYAVQLFAGGVHPETMGRALEELLDPERQVGEDDQFTLRSSNHLLPKLVFSRNTIEMFQRQPESFAAHVSIFVEQFRAGGHVGRVDDLRRGSFVSGLVHEPETSFADHGTRFGWRKGLRVEVSRRPAARENELAALVGAVHGVQAASALGAPAYGQAPIVELRLDGEGRRLLEQVHRYSDWVLTLDRHLGLEYYDRPAAAAERAYLLDFAPEYLHEDRQRLMLTTRSTVELVGLLRPALEAHGLAVPAGAEAVVLEGLRSLSGRLALRLLAAPRRSAEIVGLLLARWLLEQTGKLEERVIIPVDAHQGWFGAAAGDGAPARRADLLLVGFDPGAAVVRIAVVEVKMREAVHPGGELYAEMREQAEATAGQLRQRFDPELAAPRADAQLRAKELTTLVSFYLRRGERYRLIEPRAAVAALDFVQHLDAGFRLQVDTFGVVFERQGKGSHLEEQEPDFPVFRFGLDAAQQLLDEVWAATASAPADADEPPPTRTRTTDRRFESFRSSVGGPATLTAPATETRTPVAKPSVGDQGYGPTVPERHEISEHIETRGEGYPPPVVLPSEIADAPPAAPAILAGANQRTPQWGLLGSCGSQKLAVDLTGCNTISLFGVQGFGKSYTLGVIAEMAVASVPGINQLPSPLATVIFHYHKSDAYPPEYASAVAPNQKQREIERLLSEYGAEPRGLEDVVLLTPAGKVASRQEEFPGLEVRPIRFSSGELSAESWKFLLGAYGNDSLYVRQLVAIMRRYRERLTVADLRREIAEADLPKASRRLAEDRLALAEPYVDDHVRLGELLRPGRTVIVDLRDEWIEKDEALGLFVVMLGIFAGARHEGVQFNKLVVFDEAHKYIGDSELIGQVVEMIREMRHQATSVVIASQDPLSVPRSVIELTTVLLLHRMTSPQWLKHLKGAISALDSLSGRQLAALQPGEALLWAQRSSDPTLTQRPRKIRIRPRFTQHGGGTRTAVSNVTIR